MSSEQKKKKKKLLREGTKNLVMTEPKYCIPKNKEIRLKISAKDSVFTKEPNLETLTEFEISPEKKNANFRVPNTETAFSYTTQNKINQKCRKGKKICFRKRKKKQEHYYSYKATIFSLKFPQPSLLPNEKRKLVVVSSNNNSSSSSR